METKTRDIPGTGWEIALQTETFSRGLPVTIRSGNNPWIEMPRAITIKAIEARERKAIRVIRMITGNVGSRIGALEMCEICK